MNTIWAASLLVASTLIPQTDLGATFKVYALTLGWAVVGGISMGLGLVLSLKIFTMLTRGVDEWELIKNNNIPIAVVLASVVLGTSAVILVCVKP